MINSVTGVLRTVSRFVKCVGVSACGLPFPPNFTNLLWARSTSETDLIILVIRSVYDVLRAQSMFVKFVGVRPDVGYTLDSKYAVT